MKQLRAEIAVLEQLPWSSEEEANLELLPKSEAARVLALASGEAA